MCFFVCAQRVLVHDVEIIDLLCRNAQQSTKNSAGWGSAKIFDDGSVSQWVTPLLFEYSKRTRPDGLEFSVFKVWGSILATRLQPVPDAIDVDGSLAFECLQHFSMDDPFAECANKSLVFRQRDCLIRLLLSSFLN
jgi:hypothetical protein